MPDYPIRLPACFPASGDVLGEMFYQKQTHTHHPLKVSDGNVYEDTITGIERAGHAVAIDGHYFYDIFTTIPEEGFCMLSRELNSV
jgi:hypothetical protein